MKILFAKEKMLLEKSKYKKFLSLVFLLASVALLQDARAQESSNENKSQDLVSLSKALEARSAAVDLVPAEAIKNQDFLTFVSELRGRDRNGQPRPLARVTE